jgi:hypothetical protein
MTEGSKGHHVANRFGGAPRHSTTIPTRLSASGCTVSTPGSHRQSGSQSSRRKALEGGELEARVAALEESISACWCASFGSNGLAPCHRSVTRCTDDDRGNTGSRLASDPPLVRPGLSRTDALPLPGGSHGPRGDLIIRHPLVGSITTGRRSQHSGDQCVRILR